MKTLFLFIILSSVISFSQAEEESQAKVAVASMIRGDVELLVLGKTLKLKKDDWVKEGSVVKTADKSFVKLVFIDKSQMNIGPNSEMKIAKFNGNESGIIDLVKGQIRSKVTKDYLQMKEGDKSKLFIKTPNAVMGIRGTYFEINTNNKATSVVLFQGSVVFAKHENMRELSPHRLEAVVNQGVRMHPGEFSVVEQVRPRPTEPAVLNVEQREALEKNDSFDSDRNPSNASAGKEEAKSVVPEGLNGVIVSNTSDSIKSEVAQVAAEVNTAARSVSTSSENADGYVLGDKIKPANGSFVHLESGTIIPPGPGSVYDANTNSYIPGPGQGVVSNGGDYLPPKNVEITSDGKMMVAYKDASGVMRIQEVDKPRPVLTQSSVSLANIGSVFANNPELINPNEPVSNDILNANFVPNGLNDMSNLQLNSNGSITPGEVQTNTKTRTIIIGN